MKNLKKLTVVLFATLLSFNFTSCIDDGVSDAVDQVYLAQAQFLLAQAALKNADAQYQLARAASEQANAAYTDAQTAQQQAYTANFIATNAAANAFTDAKNAITLAELQAQSAVDLQDLATELAEAQSAYDEAMVNLATAVQDAKDVILTALYGDLQTANGKMDVLMAKKLSLEADKALKQLLLATPNGTLTWAFAQAALENQLAQYVADKAAAEANLAATQAATPNDAQQQLIDLQGQIDAVDAQVADKQVELAEAGNVVAAAAAQWNADNDEFAAIITKQGEIAFVEDEIKDHKTQISNDSISIVDTRDIIDVQIPAADQAITDAEGAVTTAENAVTTAQDDFTAASDALGTDLGDPVVTDSPSTGTTLYDVLWNAKLELAIIQADIAALTATYNTAVTDLANHIATESGLVSAQATAQSAQITAKAAYDAAVIAFDADPTGYTVTSPGADLIAGDPNNGATDYLYVVTQVAGGPNDTAISAETPGTSPLTGALETLVNVENSDGLNVASAGDYYDVEADDTSDSNANILNTTTNTLNAANATLATANLAIANYATTLATLQADYEYQQTIFDFAVTEEAAVQAIVDAAQDDVDAGVIVYDDANTALGSDSGTPSAGDSAIDPEVSAYDALWNAQLALADAEAARTALGVVDNLEDAIIAWQEDIAYTQSLMPTHVAALAYLQTELADLMAAFNLDPTLVDTEYSYGYLPSYVTWIEALQAQSAIQTEITALGAQKTALQNIYNAVSTYLLGGDNADAFETWKSGAITSLETTIGTLTTNIEKQEVLIAKGEIDADAMAAAIAEVQRQIDVVDTNIAIQDSIITSLLARINTYIN